MLAAGLLRAAVPVEATSELEILLRRTNLITRAFVKDKEIHLSFGGGAQWYVFKASWTESRAPAQEFAYAAANLETAKSSSRMPSSSSRYREVKVISKVETERLFSAAANRLVPSQPGKGIHCRYALGEAVLFRGADGQVHSAEEKPAEVVIEYRFSRQELASVAATAIEKELRATYPDLDAFVLVLGSGGGFRMAFVDCTERRVVILYVPRKGDDVYNTAHTGSPDYPI